MDTRYLDLLAEECAEVIQAVMKIKRFGLEDKYPDGRTGKAALLDEISDVFTILDYMNISAEDKRYIDARQVDKWKKLAIYGPDGTYFKDRQHPPKGKAE